MRSNKNNAINTLDHRLAMMGFSHPDSTQRNVYVHSNGDRFVRKEGCFGLGWYWYRHDIGYSQYRYGKKSVVQLMEESQIYSNSGLKSAERPAEASVTGIPCL